MAIDGPMPKEVIIHVFRFYLFFAALVSWIGLLDQISSLDRRTLVVTRCGLSVAA